MVGLFMWLSTAFFLLVFSFYAWRWSTHHSRQEAARLGKQYTSVDAAVLHFITQLSAFVAAFFWPAVGIMGLAWLIHQRTNK